TPVNKVFLDRQGLANIFSYIFNTYNSIIGGLPRPWGIDPLLLGPGERGLIDTPAKRLALANAVCDAIIPLFAPVGRAITESPVDEPENSINLLWQTNGEEVLLPDGSPKIVFAKSRPTPGDDGIDDRAEIGGLLVDTSGKSAGEVQYQLAFAINQSLHTNVAI